MADEKQAVPKPNPQLVQNAQAARKAPDQVRQENDEDVTVMVPEQVHKGPLLIRMPDHSLVEMRAGIQSIPKSLAEYGPVKIAGVKSYAAPPPPPPTAEQIRAEEELRARIRAEVEAELTAPAKADDKAKKDK